jgi:hypothetical protein
VAATNRRFKDAEEGEAKKEEAPATAEEAKEVRTKLRRKLNHSLPSGPKQSRTISEI